MPELPEVEVCRRGIAPELVGEPIVGVTIRAPKLRHEIPRELSELLPGCRIVAVRRRAKWMATLAMAACGLVLWWTAPRAWMAAIGIGCMAVTAAWLWRRPEPPAPGPR